jgi:hypothetical protein
MEIARKLAAEQALVIELNNEIADLKALTKELYDNLKLAYEALRQEHAPQ